MSLKTWKKEFYPKAASRVAKKEATAHSLRKWQGLTKTNLKKHELKIADNYVVPIIALYPEDRNFYYDGFFVNEQTCALCKKFLDEEADNHACSKCPLYKALGNISCASWDDETKKDGPYEIWLQKSNPIPMINALKKTLALEKKGKL